MKPVTPIPKTQRLSLKLPQETKLVADIAEQQTTSIAKASEPLKKVHLRIGAGNSLSTLFEKVHLPQTKLYQVLQVQHANLLENLSPKHQISFYFNENNNLQLIKYQLSQLNTLVIRNKENTFVSEIHTANVKRQQHYLTAEIHHSLYNTGIEQHIPHKLLVQLSRIFSKKINFSKDLRPNDRFTLIYESKLIDNKKETIGNIIAASITNKNNTYFALRYKNAMKHQSYFSPEGKSLKLSFDRYPVKFSHISSHFDPHRMHPILHKTRPHRGVDLAAKHGSPIHAVADGIVSQIGKNRGYGNMIKLKHNSKYETIYAHMSRFKPGLKRHDKVKRGDIIGFVGQTGLATAPHCHFEFRIAGTPTDPSLVKLPTYPNIESKQLAQFKQKTTPLIEQLKLYEAASNSDDGSGASPTLDD